MSQGIIYYNRGRGCLIRLIVCMQSLRKHYNGNVTLFQDGEYDANLIKDLQKTFGIDILFDMNPDSATLVRKIEISEKSPYDYTTLIDADMLVVGNVDETLEKAKQYEFVATNFAEWKSSGGTIRGRILRFKNARPDWMDAAINYGPAVNTGVYAFPKNSPFFKEWQPLAKYGQSIHTWIPDEVACQILLPRFKCFVLPTKYNVSVRHDPGTEDKRLIHFHGRKHVTKDKLCQLWIDAFANACEENICNITKFATREYGDRRLHKFLSGRYGREDDVKKINDIIKRKTIISVPEVSNVPEIPKAPEVPELKPEPSKENVNQKTTDEVTLVTACDKKYIGHLQLTYPNWVKQKNITKYPMIIYINGFEKGKEDPSLDFIRNHPNIRIIEWDMPKAESQRERMLSAFVFGPAKDVKTPYWIKLDADAFFTNKNELFVEEMKQYDLYGHKWHYTKPGRWIKELDEWASKIECFNVTKPIFDEKNVSGNRYSHSRIASYVQCHKTNFVQKAAQLAGERLPVPSHDTYLWYVAERLKAKWGRHNFKRNSGVSNTPHMDKLKRVLEEIDKGKEDGRSNDS